MIFSSVPWVVFTLSWFDVLWSKKVLILMNSNLSTLLWLLLVLLVSNLRDHYLTQGHKYLDQFSSKTFIVLSLTHSSMIHFEFISYMSWSRGPTSFFFFFVHGYICPSTNCWNDYSSPIEWYCQSCLKSINQCKGL